MVSKSSKLLGYVNYRMRITVLDGRQLVGRFLAFDRHMNIVLGDAEEFRRLPPKKGVPEADREVRRPLGLVLIRGESVISLTVEGPPPTDDRRGKRDVAPISAAPQMGLAPGMRPPGMPPQFMPPPGMPPGFRPGMPGMPPGMPPGMVPPGMPPPGMPPQGFVPGMPPPGFRPGMPFPPPGAYPPRPPQ